MAHQGIVNIISEWFRPAKLAIGTGLLAVLILYGYQVAQFRHYLNDDSYITLRHSHNWAEGRGPYYNPGEKVEGYTNFLLMSILAVAIRVGGADMAPSVAKGLSIVWGGGAVLGVYFLIRLFLRNSGRAPPLQAAFAGLAGAGLLAGNPAFAVNCASGLETSLFAFLLLAGVTLALVETVQVRWRGSGLVFGLAILTRPEGCFLFGIFILAQLGAGLLTSGMAGLRKISNLSILTFRTYPPALQMGLINAIIAGLFFAGHLVFRYMTYEGEWLPNTYYAKVGGFWKGSVGSYIYAGALLAILGFGGIALAGAGHLLGRVKVHLTLPLSALAFAGIALPWITGTDWMVGWRMVQPYVPLLIVWAVTGWYLLLSRPLGHSAGWTALLALCLCLAQAARSAEIRRDLQEETALRAKGYRTGHLALAHWLNAQSIPTGRIMALMDIGLIGYECPNLQVLDITGLTDRFIAKSPGGFLHKDYDPRYILDRQPEFIVLTLTTPGLSYTSPPTNAVFRFWALCEEKLYSMPDFSKTYCRPTPHDFPTTHWTERLASQIGAERIFEHAHPGCHYLLAVFRRQPGTGFPQKLNQK
jgi:arabinofuranosyltransferase